VLGNGILVGRVRGGHRPDSGGFSVLGSRVLGGGSSGAKIQDAIGVPVKHRLPRTRSDWSTDLQRRPRQAPPILRAQ
jgi:hypothetical protein